MALFQTHSYPLTFNFKQSQPPSLNPPHSFLALSDLLSLTVLSSLASFPSFILESLCRSVPIFHIFVSPDLWLVFSVSCFNPQLEPSIVLCSLPGFPYFLPTFSPFHSLHSCTFSPFCSLVRSTTFRQVLLPFSQFHSLFLSLFDYHSNSLHPTESLFSSLQCALSNHSL